MKSIRVMVWVTTLLLFIIHLVIVWTHSAILILQRLTPAFISVIYWVLIILTGIMLAAGIRKRRFIKNTSYTWCCAAFALLMSAGLVWLVTDAPSVKNDYTENAVIYSANGSFHYLDIFNTADSEALEKKSKKIDTANKKVFDAVWEEINEFRTAIEALDQFDTICDLPEGAQLNIDTPFLGFKGLREVAKIHARYFLFKVSDETSQEAVTQFCRLNRVARRGMEDSTLLINKMIFASIVEKAMETVWAAVGTGNMSQKTLRLLQESFTPIGTREISLKRPIISEYLIMKNTMREMISPENLMNSTLMVSGNSKEEKSLHPFVSSMIYYLGFKPNQNLEDMKQYYDLLIDGHRHYPVDVTPAKAYIDEYSKRPPIRNMIGWILNSIAMPDLNKTHDRMGKIKVKSDLLASFIHEKLGQTLIIEDFYSDPSLRYKKEGTLLKHPGKDGKYETGDDIILGEKDASF